MVRSDQDAIRLRMASFFTEALRWCLGTNRVPIQSSSMVREVELLECLPVLPVA